VQLGNSRISDRLSGGLLAAARPRALPSLFGQVGAVHAAAIGGQMRARRIIVP